MFIDFEGYWYISRQCIMEMLGNNIADVLQALQHLKKEVGLLIDQPSKANPEFIMSHFKKEILLAFQLDALCQSSIEIDDNKMTIYTVTDGEELFKVGDIVHLKEDGATVQITVRDQQDHSKNMFYCTRDELKTIDQEVVLSFTREPTFFFSDLELDMLEQIVRT